MQRLQVERHHKDLSATMARYQDSSIAPNMTSSRFLAESDIAERPHSQATDLFVTEFEDDEESISEHDSLQSSNKSVCIHDPARHEVLV